jgi:hypothetical protein
MNNQQLSGYSTPKGSFVAGCFYLSQETGIADDFLLFPMLSFD